MANSAEYDVIINVITGHLEKATKELKGMAGAVDGVNKAQRGAAAGAREHNDAINGGVASANNGTRGFAKLKDSINGSNGIVAAYATLATNAFAVSAAFNKLREAAQTQQVLKGLEEQGARTGISLSSTAKSVQELTHNSISAADAMRATAQVAAAGFSTKTTEALTKAAADSATALGRNVPDALDRFIKGTTKLEPELLDEMGIMVKLDQASSEYAQTLGKLPTQLTATEKRTAYLNAVLEESKRKFGGMSDAVEANPYDKLAAAFENLLTKLLNIANQSGLIDFVKTLSTNTEYLAATLVLFGSTIVKQVLPGLYGMATAAATAAAELAKEAEQQHKAVVAAQDKAAADRKAALEGVRTLKVIEQNRDAYKEYADAVKTGTQTDEQKVRALNSIRGSMAANTKELNKLLALEKDGDKTVQAEIARREALATALEGQRDAIKNLAAAEAAASSDDVAGKMAIARAKAHESSTKHMSKAQESFAVGLAEAGKGGLISSFSSIKEGLGEMKLGLKEASNASVPFKEKFTNALTSIKSGIGSAITAIIAFITASNGISRTQTILSLVTAGWTTLTGAIASAGGMMNLVKLGFTGLTMSVKVLGTAILGAIPIIGQIIFLIETIKEYGPKVYQFIANLFRTDAEKRAAAEREKTQEAIDKQIEKTKQAQEALSESFTTADKVATHYFDVIYKGAGSLDMLNAATIAQHNAISDLVSKFNELRESKAMEASISQLNNTLPELNVNVSESIKNTDAWRVASKVFALGNSGVNNSLVTLLTTTKNLREEDLVNWLKKQGTASSSVQGSFNDLADSFKAADKEAQQFAKGLVQSTSFDNFVDTLHNIQNSVKKFKEEMESGQISAAQYLNNVAQQLNTASIKAIMPKESLGILNEIEAKQSVISELQRRADNNSYIAKQRISELNQDINGDETKRAELLAKQFDTAVAMVEDLQTQERTLQSLIAAENARFKAFGRYAGETKESARAQDQHEQKIIDLEKSKMKLQLTFLDLQIEQRNNVVEELKVKKQLWELEQNRLATDVSRLKLRIADQKLEIAKGPDYKGIAVDWRSEEENRRYAEGAWQYQKDLLTTLESSLSDYNKELDANTVIMKNLDSQISSAAASAAVATKSYKDARSAILASMSALDEGQMTEAEKHARDVIADLKVTNNLYKQIVDQNSMLNAMQEERLKFNKQALIPQLYTELKVSQQQLNTQRQSLQAARVQELGMLEAVVAQKEQGLARMQRTNNAVQIEAARAELVVAQTQYEITKNTYDIRDAQLVQSAQLKLLDSASIDIYKEGLEIQKKSLDIINAKISANESLNSSLAEGRQLDAEIAAAKYGQDAVNAKLAKRLELTTAKETLALAEQQLEAKITGIKLEYALLEAQKVATILELSMQKKILETKLRASQNGGLTRDQQIMLDQLNSTIQELGKYSYNAVRDISIATAQSDVENKRKRVRLLEAQSQPGMDTQTNRILYALDSMTRIEAERQRGERADSETLMSILQDAPKAIIPDITRALDEGLQTINESGTAVEDIMSTQIKVLTDSRDYLRVMAEKLTPEGVAHLKRLEGAVASTTTGGGNKKQAATAGVQRALQSGFNVGEWAGTSVRGASGLTMRHQDPGHAGGWSYDLRAGGKSDREMTAFVESEVLKGAKAIWHGLVYELKNGQIQTSTYTPSKNATGGDIMHERHAHLSYANAIISSTSSVDKSSESLDRASEATDRFTTSMDRASSAAEPPTSQAMDEGRPAEIDAMLRNIPRFNLDEGLGDFRAEMAQRNSERNQNYKMANVLAGNRLGDTSEFGQKGHEKAFDYTTQLMGGIDKIREDLKAQGNLSAEEFNRAFIERSAALSETLYQSIFPAGAMATKVSEFWAGADVAAQPFLDTLKTLGPQGELVASVYSGLQNISTGVTGFMASLESGQDRLQSFATLASNILSTVGNIMAASSKAKIANIDKEIAAEQKRDGKSAESVAKIAQLQKKKEAEEKKAFNRDKKLKMAETVIATAAAVMKAAPNVGKMVLMGALGAAQLAIIASSKYEGASTTDTSVNMPSTLSIGKRSDTVDLAKGPNANAGGEVAYLRGSDGIGSNASNYRTVGSAYGGDLTRGYGNRGFVVGEKGPEIISPETPINVTPADKITSGQPINANISIHAIDSQGVQDVLVAQKGNIIKMLREAANASGKKFMEDVNVNVYTRPNVGKL